MNKSVQAQRGAILPFLVVGLLLIGIFVATGLVQVPQIFNPKAASNEVKFVGDGVRLEGDKYVTTNSTVDVELTSPYGLQSSGNPTTSAQPLFEDDFSNHGTHQWALRETDRHYVGRFVNGALEAGIKHTRGYNYGNENPATYATYPVFQKPPNSRIGTDRWTVIFDARLEGTGDLTRALGVWFGSPNRDNDQDPWFSPYINTEGEIEVFYFPNVTDPRQSIYKANNKLALELGKNYKFRFDHRPELLKIWISPDNGSTWQFLAEAPLDPTKSAGDGFGFAVRKWKGMDESHTTIGTFDNLKIYRLGDLPEPGASGVFRYAGDPEFPENDPDGVRVQWQPYSAHPTKFPITLNSGTNVVYAQFKSASGEKSQIYQGVIELLSNNPTPDPTPTDDPNAACQDKCFSDQLWVGISRRGDVCDDTHPTSIYTCGVSSAAPGARRMSYGEEANCGGSTWVCVDGGPGVGLYWSRKQ